MYVCIYIYIYTYICLMFIHIIQVYVYRKRSRIIESYINIPTASSHEFKVQNFKVRGSTLGIIASFRLNKPSEPFDNSKLPGAGPCFQIGLDFLFSPKSSNRSFLVTQPRHVGLAKTIRRGMSEASTASSRGTPRPRFSQPAC